MNEDPRKESRMVYEWQDRTRVGVSAQTIGEHLETLRMCKGWLKADRQGILTPSDILNDAKRKQSPLHNAFEWDNDVVAEQFRLIQARRILCGVIVVSIEKP